MYKKFMIIYLKTFDCRGGGRCMKSSAFFLLSLYHVCSKKSVPRTTSPAAYATSTRCHISRTSVWWRASRSATTDLTFHNGEKSGDRADQNSNRTLSVSRKVPTISATYSSALSSWNVAFRRARIKGRATCLTQQKHNCHCSKCH